MIEIKRIYSDQHGFHKVEYSENDRIETEAFISTRAEKLLTEGITQGFNLLQIQSTVTGNMIRAIIIPEDMHEIKRSLEISDEQIIDLHPIDLR